MEQRLTLMRLSRLVRRRFTVARSGQCRRRSGRNYASASYRAGRKLRATYRLFSLKSGIREDSINGTGQIDFSVSPISCGSSANGLAPDPSAGLLYAGAPAQNCSGSHGMAGLSAARIHDKRQAYGDPEVDEETGLSMTGRFVYGTSTSRSAAASSMPTTSATIGSMCWSWKTQCLQPRERFIHCAQAVNAVGRRRMSEGSPDTRSSWRRFPILSARSTST
jgi:hypothetical protein